MLRKRNSAAAKLKPVAQPIENSFAVAAPLAVNEAALRQAQQRIDFLTRLADNLLERKNQLQSILAEPSAAIARCESLKKERRELIDKQLLIGAAADTMLLDRELAKAENEVEKTKEAAAAAQSEIDELEHQFSAVGVELSKLNAAIPQLMYSAIVEHVVLKALPKLKEESERFCKALAEVTGCALAADSFSSNLAKPPRPPIAGLLMQSEFAVGLPDLPGINRSEWQFNVRKQTEAALAATIERFEHHARC